MQPKLLSYKPLTSSILHAPKEVSDLKQQLKNQIEQFEEFQKQKEQIEAALNQKEQNFIEKEKNYNQLQSFANNALKLSNFMLKAIHISQNQISTLQTDLSIAKQQITSFTERERKINYFIQQFNPIINVKKIPFKNRLNSVKLMIIFSVRIKRLGKSYKSTKEKKIFLPGQVPEKDILQFNDFLKINYLDDISALNSLILPQSSPQPIIVNFSTEKTYVLLCEILNKINLEKQNLISQNSEYLSQLSIQQEQINAFQAENSNLKIELSSKNGVVEINKFQALATENMLLLEKFNTQQQENKELKRQILFFENENSALKQNVDQGLNGIIESNQKSIRISELMEEIYQLKEGYGNKNKLYEQVNDGGYEGGERMVKNGKKTTIRSLEDFNIEKKQHQLEYEEFQIEEMQNKYIRDKYKPRSINDRVNQLEEKVKLVKGARLGQRIQELLDF